MIDFLRASLLIMFSFMFLLNAIVYFIIIPVVVLLVIMSVLSVPHPELGWLL